MERDRNEHLKASILRDRSYQFAIRIVRLSQFLQTKKKEFVLAKQVLRSGTAVGAVIREYGESKPDFAHKLSVAVKEAYETEYWIDLLHDTNY